MGNENRRPLATRRLTIFHRKAALLIKLGLHPNHISVASSLFAILGCFFFIESVNPSFSKSSLFLVMAAVCIQLRLLCNLMDGLMAVEGGLKTPTGELYNDVPDRISDIFLLVGVGFAAQTLDPRTVDLGWLAAILAILTAYVRILGASLTGAHDFSGPMAKPQRMFLLTIGALGTIVENYFGFQGHVLTGILILIILGSLVTCVNRLYKISSVLNSKAS